MDKSRILELKKLYEDELFTNVVPFWTKFAPDWECGGLFNYVDRDGSLLSTDKSGWFQGRGTWCFARLYNDFGRKEEWLDIARLGYEFIVKRCFDNDGRMFFEMTRDGKPLRKRRYWFAEAFAVMAMAEYYRASGDKDALNRAKELYSKILGYYDHSNPDLFPPKYISNNYEAKSHNYRMILISTSQVLRDAEYQTLYDQTIDRVTEELFYDFVKEDIRALMEVVRPDGNLIDTPAGRRLNPGHAMETAWFLLIEGERRKNGEVVKKALDIIEWSIERGWDENYGGIFNYVDLDGKPSDKIEWDMKYWWTHCEALIATLLAFHLSKDTKFETMFNKIHEYTFKHFPDREYGEWYGYLHRDGSICLPVKGTLFKGPFHIPRFLMYGIKILEKMSSDNG